MLIMAKIKIGKFHVLKCILSSKIDKKDSRYMNLERFNIRKTQFYTKASGNHYQFSRLVKRDVNSPMRLFTPRPQHNVDSFGRVSTTQLIIMLSLLTKKIS